MLLRVGIDKGTDGTLAPIFANGTFEFIPISERSKSKENRAYREIIGRYDKLLSTYLPRRIWNRIPHFDPEFDTFTYGDPTGKRKYLLKLEKDDVLVFYAGLKPFGNKNYKEALYIIGYFTIEQVIDFNQLTNKEIEKYRQLYSNNAHFKRIYDIEDVVMVAGNENKSKLVDKAVLISEKKYNRNGKPYQAVSGEMEAFLGISGSIQRSIPPRFIRNENNLNNLKYVLGL